MNICTSTIFESDTMVHYFAIMATQRLSLQKSGRHCHTHNEIQVYFINDEIHLNMYIYIYIPILRNVIIVTPMMKYI